MLRGTLFALLMMVAGLAGATSIYKCVSGGRVTYSGTQCRHGSMSEMQVRSGPRSRAREARRARRQAEVAATTRKNRLAVEAAERAKAKDGNAVAAGRARRCAMLQFEQKQAERGAGATPDGGTDSTRAEAARRRAKMAIECPG